MIFIDLVQEKGSVLNPLLFNIVTSKIMQEFLLSVSFADDIFLASDRVAKHQKVFDKRQKIFNDLSVNQV